MGRELGVFFINFIFEQAPAILQNFKVIFETLSLQASLQLVR